MKISTMIALGALAFTTCALYADNLDLTSSYNNVPFSSNGTGSGTYGGGSLSGATLNGVALSWVYCVQLTVDVPVPADYDQTIVDNTGVIQNTGSNPTPTQADSIAWLLTNYANAAVGSTTSDIDAQIALQAAIWNVEGFGDLETGANSTETTDYNTDLNALLVADNSDPTAGASDVSNFVWMTPGTAGSNQYQGLVTSVPDGGMTLMLLGGVLGGLETLRRKVRA